MSKRGVIVGLLAVLLGASVPVTPPARAAYPLRPGQEVSIFKAGLPPATVILRGARVDSVALPRISVSLFGMSYQVDAAAVANAASATVGSYVTVVGTLDPANALLVRASVLQVVGTGGGGGGPGPGGSGNSSTTATGLCATGGQVANSGGAEGPLGTAVVGLVRQALGCPSTWTFGPPPEGMRYSGSANHKLLWRTWYYGWAMRAGTQAQKEDARNFLIDFFDRQEGREGHYMGETLTTSHYQIWLNGVTAARFLATAYQDQRLLATTGKWWRHEFGLYDLLSRDGVIYSPGLRIPEGFGPVSQLRNVVYALLKNRPLTGNPANPESNFWKDYYNVGAWTIKNLLARGDDLGGAARATKATDLPVLQDPLCTYVKGNDFVFVFPKISNGADPLYWVARINGTVRQAPYRRGGAPGDNPFPPPSLPGATLTVVPGPNGVTGCPATI